MFNNNIVSPSCKKHKPLPEIQVFRSFYDAACHGYRTSTGWDKSLRRVHAKRANAIVVRQVGVVTGLAGYEVVLQDCGHNRFEVATDYVNAYSLDQTRPFTSRRAAQQRYLDIFFTHARKDEYGLWADDHWSTVTAEETGRPWDRTALTADMALRHANHGNTLALKSDGKTHFVVIDLDCHEKVDVDLFLRRAERLLQRFHGDGWHYQLRDGTITGLHFIKVFDWPRRLDEAREWAADQLRQMDEPGLDLMKLEIYPTFGGNGIRLALAKGYLLILDNIVDPVVYRKQQVGDVERYVNWLEEDNRQYFPKDRLMSYLRMNVRDGRSPLLNGSIILVCKKEQTRKPEGHGLGAMKGSFWSKLTDYWSGRWNPPGALDEAITMTARVGYKLGYTEDEIVSIIKSYCRSLPEGASSRLTNPRELNRCITKQVRGVEANKRQKDYKKSDCILGEVVAAWKAKGIDLLNKATWNCKKLDCKAGYDFRDLGLKLSPEDLHAGTVYLATAFPEKCKVVAKQNIEQIMLAMAKLAQIKHQEENGISAVYWQKFFKDQFHLELCVRNIWDVLKAAIELEVIERHCGWHRGRSTMYTVGKRMAKYFAVPRPIDGSIILVCNKDQELPEDWERIVEETILPIDEQLMVLC